MRKMISCAWPLIVLCLLLTGCGCTHEWTEAGCSVPETCAKCGQTQGEALGHDWISSTCESSETCSRCQETRGDAPGHIWQAATCTTPEICSVCGSVSGNMPDHEWVPATCDAPETCRNCGEARGLTTPHVYGLWDDQKMEHSCTLCGNTQTIDDVITGQWTGLYCAVDSLSTETCAYKNVIEYTADFRPDGSFTASMDREYTGTWEFSRVRVTDRDGESRTDFHFFVNIRGVAEPVVAYVNPQGKLDISSFIEVDDDSICLIRPDDRVSEVLRQGIAEIPGSWTAVSAARFDPETKSDIALDAEGYQLTVLDDYTFTAELDAAYTGTWYFQHDLGYVFHFCGSDSGFVYKIKDGALNMWYETDDDSVSVKMVKG